MSVNINFLGILNRANKIVTGKDSVKRESYNGRVKLIICAVDFSTRAKSDMKRFAEENGIPFLEKWTKQELGVALGRGETGLVGVLDKSVVSKFKGVL